MAKVSFTASLRRHREARSAEADGDTVREVLERVLGQDPLLRSYVLDDQGRLRRHVNVFVGGQPVGDRLALSDPVRPGDEIYVLQALSGAEMTDALHVASRKGLFTFRRANGGWRAGPPAFLGEPVTAVLTDARDGAVYAALRLGHFGCKLHRHDGETWQELPAPAYPPAPEGAEGAALDMIWTIAAGGPDAPGELWAGTLPGGLFRSPDRGASWSLVESLWSKPERSEWFGGGYDHPGIHSILVDPRDPNRLTVGVSCGGVWKSDDRGASWRLAGKGLRAAFMPPERAYDPNIQDPHLIAACAAAPDVVWCQHHNGMFRSTDGGASFAELEPPEPSAFGFAVAPHPADPLTAWFAPAVKDECRVPVDGKLVVTRTRDGGASFEVLGEGLPTGASYDLIYRHALVVDPAGTRLAMGSTTGNLWVSDSAGEGWEEIAGHLPPIAQVAFA